MCKMKQSSEHAIHVAGLRKSYDDFEAVRGIDFDVAQGEVFGLLGPNGAGKTTTVEILEGLRPRTAGDVQVLGYDPGADTRAIKDRIGVCLQSTNLPDKITVRESLALFSARSNANRIWVRRRRASSSDLSPWENRSHSGCPK